jgi:hypothetical protein
MWRYTQKRTKLPHLISVLITRLNQKDHFVLSAKLAVMGDGKFWVKRKPWTICALLYTIERGLWLTGLMSIEKKK